MSAVLACSMPAVERSIAIGRMGTVARHSVRCMFGRAVRPAIVSVLVLNAVAGFVTTLLVRLPAELGIGGMPEYARLSIALGWGAVLATFVVVAPTRVGAGAPISLACGGAAVVALGVVPHLLAATMACAFLGGAVMASEMAAATRITTRIAAPFVAPAVGVLDAAMVAAMVIGAVVAPLAIETIGTRAGVIIAGVAALVAAAVTSPILTHRSAVTVRPNEPPVGAIS